MKKYIRTKDGRIELVIGSVKDQTDILFYDDNKGNYIAEKDIIKQTDTIEELCDEFIIKWSDGTYCKSLMDGLGQAKYWLNRDNKAIIFGAIWTDKGLIYVAKMNEKGELELL